MKRDYISVNSTNLHYIDFGGEGANVLLLHGLMGRALTWADTARWLTKQCHVVAIDQRGHGLSSKPDNAYSRDDYVDDAIGIIEKLRLAPAILIGHSMGALNAWVLAARRPDLVCGLIIEDMAAGTANRKEQGQWKNWFDSWPVPFNTLKDVRDYFYRQRPSYADYFMEVMTEKDDGYRPLFQFEHMLKSLEDWENHSYWAELEAIKCPTLVVRGGESSMPKEEMEQMAEKLEIGRFIEIEQAGHVVHYDQPVAWRNVVECFIKELIVHS